VLLTLYEELPPGIVVNHQVFMLRSSLLLGLRFVSGKVLNKKLHAHVNTTELNYKFLEII